MKKYNDRVKCTDNKLITNMMDDLLQMLQPTFGKHPASANSKSNYGGVCHEMQFACISCTRHSCILPLIKRRDGWNDSYNLINLHDG